MAYLGLQYIRKVLLSTAAWWQQYQIAGLIEGRD